MRVATNLQQFALVAMHLSAPDFLVLKSLLLLEKEPVILEEYIQLQKISKSSR